MFEVGMIFSEHSVFMAKNGLSFIKYIYIELVKSLKIFLEQLNFVPNVNSSIFNCLSWQKIISCLCKEVLEE